MADRTWVDGVDPDIETFLGVIWGKSDAGGRPNLLVQHLFDAMAVGELLWDEYVAPSLRARIDELSGGHGRSFLAWLCGIHDVGKATPAFQDHVPELAGRVREAGLVWRAAADRRRRGWRHDRAGGRAVSDELRQAWADDRDQVRWLWPMVAGHHGAVPTTRDINGGDVDLQGTDPRWARVRRCLLEVIALAAGYRSLAEVRPVQVPNRADQLLLIGLVVMADWISSDEHRFPGIDELGQAGPVEARDRARNAWRVLQMRGGWRGLPIPDGDVVEARFGWPAHPAQTAVVEAARTMGAPGLLIVEAPMGEGKTEAALAAVEVLAARFGADGLFVGMPTQATADPMFERVLHWIDAVGRPIPLALLHGKKAFNPEWRKLLARRPAQPPEVRGEPVDQFGMSDEPPPVMTNVCEDGHDDGDGEDQRAPAQWFLGHKRGLLVSGVGTVDQLLFAGTRTRHVMLRYAGLAGKVVVLDEVHAADVYMSQFLGEALTWLGQGKVPVVLLSATLAPGQRRELVRCYLAGALRQARLSVDELPVAAGYPSVTAAWAEVGAPRWDVTIAEPRRASTPVAVELLSEDPDDQVSPVVQALERELVDGGCALVIRNTVARAQELYTALAERWGSDVHLLHARFAAGDRADRAQEILERLGPDRPDSDAGPRVERPKRMVVVATQIAEQSFDIDADLLVTDLAPVDLLAQRAGRLHRHERSTEERPPRLQEPKMIVTGVSPCEGASPTFPKGSAFVYGSHLLLGSAALVEEAAAGNGWSVPADVPSLVARLYEHGVDLPDAWTQAAAAARQEWEQEEAHRASAARAHLLGAPGELRKPTLEGLHRGGSASSDPEAHVRVRDGDSSVEVLLVRRDDRGFWSLRGEYLGVHGERARDDPMLALPGLVRLPAWPPDLAVAAEKHGPLAEWNEDPWLRRTHVVELDERAEAVVGDHRLRYDDALGLLIDRR